MSASYQSVWTLNDVSSQAVAGTWPTYISPPYNNFGYFAGRDTGAVVSNAEKLSFASNTSTLPGSALTLARGSLGATATNSFAWFAGGYAVAPKNNVDCLTFASDTITMTAKGALTQQKSATTAITNGTNNYWCGGNLRSGNSVSLIDRLIIATDSVAATTTANLSSSKNSSSGVSNKTYGYIAGGFTYPPGSKSAAIDKFIFSTDTVNATVTASSYRTAYMMKACANDTYAWFAGGYTGGFQTTIDRFTFATDTVGSVSYSNLLHTRDNASCCASGIAGYFAGGYDGTSSFSSNMDKMSFSSGTVSGYTGALTAVCSQNTGVITSIAAF